MMILFILSLAAVAVSVAVKTSTSTHLPATAVPTSFVGSTITKCMHSCVADAAYASNHCYGAGMCGCIDPKVQQAVATCMQSRCSFPKEVALQLQHGTKCYRDPPIDGYYSYEQGPPVPSYHAGPDHGSSDASFLTETAIFSPDDLVFTSGPVASSSSSTSNSSSEASSSMTDSRLG